MRIFNSILNILRFNRKNWRAVLLCIFAATIFWFFNALNKSYTTNINFPLRFEFDQDAYVPVNTLPQYIRINVTGNGWDLFKRSTGVKISALEIPLDRPAEVKKIIGSTLPVFFTSQLDGLEINYVLTDTLFLDLEPKKGRWLTLRIDSVNQYLRQGYLQASDAVLMPDSVYITGPARIINALKEPFAIHLQQRNIDEDFMGDVEIDLPHSDVIQRDPPTVAVLFDVESAVTVKDSVLIDVENVPPTVSFVETRYIPITLQVPANKLEKFNIDSARAVLDLKGFQRGSARLLPRVKGLPPFVVITEIDSVNIRL